MLTKAKGNVHQNFDVTEVSEKVDFDKSEI